MLISTLSRLNFRPRSVALLMESEPVFAKLRIIGFAFVMAAVTGYFQVYFYGLVYRSNQF